LEEWQSGEREALILPNVTTLMFDIVLERLGNVTSPDCTAAREVLWKVAWRQEWLERLAPDRLGGVLGTA
jgi:hypothetical protein